MLAFRTSGLLMAATVASIGFATMAAAPARAPVLAALGLLEPGQWQLTEQSNAPSRLTQRICVGDAAALLQVRHAGASCSRYVIENEAKHGTVHYTCPGAGHGRTTIRVETPRLVRIDSQGIADNAPFEFVLEGRRIGPCPTGMARH